MKNLKTLVLMQLKDKIDFSFVKSVKKTIFKVVLSILKFLIITGIIYIGFYVLSMLNLVSLVEGIPQNFFTVLFSAMYLLSIIVCTFGLMKNLYFTKDNALLLTLPTKRTTVFTSKLIVYYLYELVRNITYILPLFIAYALINKFKIYFYLWLIVMYLFIVALPVVIGALLSIPFMYITKFIKQYKILEYSVLVVGITLAVYLIVTFINAMPTNIDLIGNWGKNFWAIQDFLNKTTKILVPIAWLVTAVVGTRYSTKITMFDSKQFLSVLGIIGLIVGIVAITYVIVRPLFFQMASSPFEYKKKKIHRQIKNKKHLSFLSSIKKEILLSYRTPEKFYGLLLIALGMPIAILFLNKIYSAMDTRLSGTNMAIIFNVLMILLLALSSNANMSKTYSEEGASGYLVKTVPKSYLKTLFSKVFVNIVTVSISLLVTTFIFTKNRGYNTSTALTIYLLLESVYLAHLFMSAEADVMNPQNAQYQMTGTHHNNPNELKSTVYTFVLSALFAGLTFFFLTKSPDAVWTKVMFIALAFLSLRVYLYVNKIKVYFKEK